MYDIKILKNFDFMISGIQIAEIQSTFISLSSKPEAATSKEHFQNIP
jgi:hypothetical protein